MKTSTLIKSFAVAAALAAPWIFSSCATHSGMPAPAPAMGAPSADQRGSQAARSSTAESADYSARKSRPGLGTGWGSSVKSEIGHTSFNRASNSPAGISSIYYNDKEGIEAMTSSWKYSGSGMQRAANGLVEWGVKGTWGSLKNYNSSGRRYVIGRKGSNYSLVIKNLCHSRLEIVLSVDGLDVMDGKTASFKKRGYIIQPGKTLTVAGFRTSESAVASFKFSSMAGSYSNLRHGTTRNVGVMGMAVFTEKGIDPWKWSRSAVKARHGATPFAEAPYARAR